MRDGAWKIVVEQLEGMCDVIERRWVDMILRIASEGFIASGVYSLVYTYTFLPRACLEYNTGH